MPDLNKANRQVCDLDIRILDTKKPFLFFETANTTTMSISAESVFAMAKGAKKIAFQDPMDGTLAVEAQVYPFKLFALMSDGIIDTTAVYADKQTVTCASGGSLALTLPTGGTIQTGTVFVYPKDKFGDETALIAGTYSNGTFTATTAADIAQGSDYVVGYLISRTAGLKKIAFNNKRLPKDYYITASTLDKDEDGVLTPFKQVYYKASVQRNFELAFSSEGDPATVTVTFDIMEDKNGNYVDMIEITDEGMTTNKAAVRLAKGATAEDVTIYGAVGTVTAVIKDSSDQTATKVHATISGDNDNVIISADSDATAGDYTVTLTDSGSQTTKNTATVYAA